MHLPLEHFIAASVDQQKCELESLKLPALDIGNVKALPNQIHRLQVLLCVTPSLAAKALSPAGNLHECLLQDLLANVENPERVSAEIITAIVDEIPTPKPVAGTVLSDLPGQEVANSGADGVAYVAAFDHAIFHDWSDSAAVVLGRMKDISALGTSSSSLSVLTVKGPGFEGACDGTNVSIDVPLANTTFTPSARGKSSILLREHWEFDDTDGGWRRIDASYGEAITVVWPTWAAVDHSTVEIALTPFTVPRRIEAGMGNVIRQTSGGPSGSPMPASQELEQEVAEFFKFFNIPPAAIQAWALVIPESVAEEYMQSQEIHDPADIKAIWEDGLGSFDLPLDHLFARGVRLHRVLSGGGGWGQKAGLISLDPDCTFAKSSRSGSDFDQDFENSLDMFKSMQNRMLGDVATCGSYVQFFVYTGAFSDSLNDSRHIQQGEKLQGDQAEQDCVRFGTVPSSVDSHVWHPAAQDAPSQLAETKSDTAEQWTFVPNAFGALSEQGISMSMDQKSPFRLPGQPSTLKSKLDVPYSSITFTGSRPSFGYLNPRDKGIRSFCSLSDSRLLTVQGNHSNRRLECSFYLGSNSTHEARNITESGGRRAYYSEQHTGSTITSLQSVRTIGNIMTITSPGFSSTRTLAISSARASNLKRRTGIALSPFWTAALGTHEDLARRGPAKLLSLRPKSTATERNGRVNSPSDPSASGNKENSNIGRPSDTASPKPASAGSFTSQHLGSTSSRRFRFRIKKILMPSAQTPAVEQPPIRYVRRRKSELQTPHSQEDRRSHWLVPAHDRNSQYRAATYVQIKQPNFSDFDSQVGIFETRIFEMTAQTLQSALKVKKGLARPALSALKELHTSSELSGVHLKSSALKSDLAGNPSASSSGNTAERQRLLLSTLGAVARNTSRSDASAFKSPKSRRRMSLPRSIRRGNESMQVALLRSNPKRIDTEAPRIRMYQPTFRKILGSHPPEPLRLSRYLAQPKPKSQSRREWKLRRKYAASAKKISAAMVKGKRGARPSDAALEAALAARGPRRPGFDKLPTPEEPTAPANSGQPSHTDAFDDQRALERARHNQRQWEARRHAWVNMQRASRQRREQPVDLTEEEAKQITHDVADLLKAFIP